MASWQFFTKTVQQKPIYFTLLFKANCKEEMYVKNLFFAYGSDKFCAKMWMDPEASNWLLVWAYKKTLYLKRYFSIYVLYYKR